MTMRTKEEALMTLETTLKKMDKPDALYQQIVAEMHGGPCVICGQGDH